MIQDLIKNRKKRITLFTTIAFFLFFILLLVAYRFSIKKNKNKDGDDKIYFFLFTGLFLSIFILIGLVAYEALKLNQEEEQPDKEVKSNSDKDKGGSFFQEETTVIKTHSWAFYLSLTLFFLLVLSDLYLFIKGTRYGRLEFFGRLALPLYLVSIACFIGLGLHSNFTTFYILLSIWLAVTFIVFAKGVLLPTQTLIFNKVRDRQHFFAKQALNTGLKLSPEKTNRSLNLLNKFLSEFSFGYFQHDTERMEKIADSILNPFVKKALALRKQIQNKSKQKKKNKPLSKGVFSPPYTYEEMSKPLRAR